jgi:hypothetical protein
VDILLNNLAKIKSISFFQTLSIIFVFPLDKGRCKPEAKSSETGSLASNNNHVFSAVNVHLWAPQMSV